LICPSRPSQLHPQIWKYPVNQQDEIRCVYLKADPYRWFPSNSFEYSFSDNEKNHQIFQSSWYTMFDWLKYSFKRYVTYFLSCYIFSKNSTRRFRAHAFTIEGFHNWKKVNDGMDCAFLGHMGNGSCLPYNNDVKYCDSLMNQSQYIDMVIDKQTLEEKLKNQL
jgi:hypothetical protein